jgi:putative membrane protein
VLDDHHRTGDGVPTAEEFEPDYRFTLANERTFLAWQRTALGLLAAAVAMVQLVPELSIPGLRHVIGGVLAALALLTALSGLRRWSLVDGAVRRGLPLPRDRTPFLLGIGLAAVAILCVAVMASKAVTG